ncbi:MAG: hypothetical protein AB7J28_10230 [Hyphomonadaceae bacterium]
MRGVLLFIAAFAMAAPAAATQTEDRTRAALAAGNEDAAAAALTEALTRALAQSGARFQAASADTLRADLARDLADMPRDARANLDIAWRASLTGGRGPCAGLIDVGNARVTASSTQRTSRGGVSRFACTLATQGEDGFGWASVAVLQSGEGGVVARFRVEADDPMDREQSARSLSRALERILASVSQQGAERAAPPRARPAPVQPRRPAPAPRQPQPRPTQPPVDVEDTI